MSHAADTWMTRHAGRSDEGDQVEQRAPTSHWDALNPQAAMQCFGLVATTGDQSISNKPGLLITRFEGGGCSSGRNGRSNGIKRDGLRVVPHRVERDGSLLLGATKHRTVPPLFFAPIVHTRVVGSTVPIYSTRSLSDSVTTTRLWRYLDGGLMRHNRCPSNCKDQIGWLSCITSVRTPGANHDPWASHARANVVRAPLIATSGYLYFRRYVPRADKNGRSHQ